jgi:hypothetical protein
MHNFRVWACAGAFLAYFALSGFVPQDRELDAPQLREMLSQLGYEIKDLNTEAGKEKYSVKVERDGLNIPVAFEISPSKAYVWLTINLGETPSAERALELLKQNSKIQPSQFYVTSNGRLMIALPLENRNVTNALIRNRMDALSANVGRTQEFWKAK